MKFSAVSDLENVTDRRRRLALFPGVWLCGVLYLLSTGADTIFQCGVAICVGILTYVLSEVTRTRYARLRLDAPISPRLRIDAVAKFLFTIATISTASAIVISAYDKVIADPARLARIPVCSDGEQLVPLGHIEIRNGTGLVGDMREDECPGSWGVNGYYSVMIFVRKIGEPNILQNLVFELRDPIKSEPVMAWTGPTKLKIMYSNDSYTEVSKNVEFAGGVTLEYLTVH